MVALIVLGTLKLGKFELDEAEALFRRVVANAPHDIAALRSLARVASSRGLRSQALDHLETARRANPTHIGIALEIAGELRALGQYDLAGQLIEEELRLRPRDLAASIQLALLHRARGDRPKAVRVVARSARTLSRARSVAR